MLVSDIVKLINSNIVGDSVTRKQATNLINYAIDEINNTLNTYYPTITNNTDTYEHLPDKYIRQAVVPGAVSQYYQIEGEGVTGDTKFTLMFNNALFVMLRDFYDCIPEVYLAPYTGSISGGDDMLSSNLSVDNVSPVLEGKMKATEALPDVVFRQDWAHNQFRFILRNPIDTTELQVTAVYCDEDNVPLPNYTAICTMVLTDTDCSKVFRLTASSCYPRGAKKICISYNDTHDFYDIEDTSRELPELYSTPEFACLENFSSTDELYASILAAYEEGVTKFFIGRGLEFPVGTRKYLSVANGAGYYSADTATQTVRYTTAQGLFSLKPDIDIDLYFPYLQVDTAVMGDDRSLPDSVIALPSSSGGEIRVHQYSFVSFNDQAGNVYHTVHPTEYNGLLTNTATEGCGIDIKYAQQSTSPLANITPLQDFPKCQGSYGNCKSIDNSYLKVWLANTKTQRTYLFTPRFMRGLEYTGNPDKDLYVSGGRALTNNSPESVLWTSSYLRTSAGAARDIKGTEEPRYGSLVNICSTPPDNYPDLPRDYKCGHWEYAGRLPHAGSEEYANTTQYIMTPRGDTGCVGIVYCMMNGNHCLRWKNLSNGCWEAGFDIVELPLTNAAPAIGQVVLPVGQYSYSASNWVAVTGTDGVTQYKVPRVTSDRGVYHVIRKDVVTPCKLVIYAPTLTAAQLATVGNVLRAIKADGTTELVANMTPIMDSNDCAGLLVYEDVIGFCWSRAYAQGTSARIGLSSLSIEVGDTLGMSFEEEEE